MARFARQPGYMVFQAKEVGKVRSVHQVEVCCVLCCVTLRYAIITPLTSRPMVFSDNNQGVRFARVRGIMQNAKDTIECSMPLQFLATQEELFDLLTSV
jgi:hypothetical protein